MNLKPKFIIIALLVILFSTSAYRFVRAQSTSTRWTSPEQLSSENRQSSEGYMVSDQYGYVHVFWSETGSPDRRPSIMYSRFNGSNWIPPIDLFMGPPDAVINSISPFVDNDGMLHLVWPISNSGPLLYSKVPAYEASSARNWSDPIRINEPTFLAKLLVDSRGTIHILFSEFYGESPGIYYFRSEDDGASWSSAIQLDQDIPDGYAPHNINFAIDDSDGLHALWYYMNLSSAQGEWIRYSNSLDGGNTWSIPFTVDRAEEGTGELRMPIPELAVIGDEVHIIWAGDHELHREHRYSTDSGQTWYPSTQIMGGLVGQALGGGMDVDSLERAHYVTQVRYPMGIYHTYWDQDNWSIPTLAYFILGGYDESFGERIHAHNVRLAIRNGNQLVITFTSSPSDPQLILYEIHRTLDGVPEETSIPIPTPTLSPIPTTTESPVEIQPTQKPTLTANPPTRPNVEYNPALGVFWGLLTSLTILLGVIAYQFIRNR